VSIYGLYYYIDHDTPLPTRCASRAVDRVGLCRRRRRLQFVHRLQPSAEISISARRCRMSAARMRSKIGEQWLEGWDEYHQELPQSLYYSFLNGRPTSLNQWR